MVFDGIIGSPREEASNGGPPVAVAGMGSDDGVILRLGERVVLDAGTELVTPTEPAGFSRAALYVSTN